MPGTLVSGVYFPVPSAAAAVTSLKVEPGGRTSSIARLFSGLGLAFSRRCLVLPAATKSWLAIRLGLKVGLETIARILPVRGSIATTAPRTLLPSARSPSYAACCASGSTVRVTLPPFGASLSTRSMTRFDEERGVAAGQDRVLGRLDGAEAPVAGEVAGEVGVLRPLRVDPLELVGVVGLVALGDRLAADQDGAALAGELRVADALVVGVLAQRGEVVGLPVLHVGRVDQQRDEQQHAGDGEVADRLVHRGILTTWVASAS